MTNLYWNIDTLKQWVLKNYLQLFKLELMEGLKGLISAADLTKKKPQSDCECVAALQRTGRALHSYSSNIFLNSKLLANNRENKGTNKID